METAASWSFGIHTHTHTHLHMCSARLLCTRTIGGGGLLHERVDKERKGGSCMKEFRDSGFRIRDVETRQLRVVTAQFRDSGFGTRVKNRGRERWGGREGEGERKGEINNASRKTRLRA
jgi:hypothetical protein